MDFVPHVQFHQQSSNVAIIVQILFSAKRKSIPNPFLKGFFVIVALEIQVFFQSTIRQLSPVEVIFTVKFP
jgi:hypothetical protein